MTVYVKRTYKIVAVFLLFFFGYCIFPKPKKNIRIGILSNADFCGEREVACRMKRAAESLGWDVYLDEKRGRVLRKIKDLDWVACLIPNTRYLHKQSTNFMTIFHPFDYFDDQGNFVPFYEKYDGYLMTIPLPTKLSEHFAAKGRELFTVPFYPSVQPVEYKKVPLGRLMTMIPVWGNRLSDAKFKQLYSALSRTGEVCFYGLDRNPEIIEQGYMGKIPFDGSSVIPVLQEHGIVLIFHSDVHNREGIPSARIFEAAAASAVIISDENSFVKDHFGDSVYYLDTSKSAEEMFAQIQSHLAAIRSDPEGALAKARRAHEIFEEEFLMSEQLLRIQSLHETIKEKKKWFFERWFSL